LKQVLMTRDLARLDSILAKDCRLKWYRLVFADHVHRNKYYLYYQ